MITQILHNKGVFDMFVRSQDKEELIDIDKKRLLFWFDGYSNNSVFLDPIAMGSDKRIKLGIYKTKERALEVLDEIQKQYVSNKMIEILDGNNITITETTEKLFVYQMPIE
jgi:hypothetical protein